MIDGSSCPSCGRDAVPPEPRCPACRSQTSPETFPDHGRVLARTRTDPDADWIALVELDEGPRVLARMGKRPRIGDEVELEAAGDGADGAFRAR